MIRLTNEEYEAIMEAREELAINEMKDDIKLSYAMRRAKELNSNKAGHGYANSSNKRKSDGSNIHRPGDQRAEDRYRMYKRSEDELNSQTKIGNKKIRQPLDDSDKRYLKRAADQEIARHDANRSMNHPIYHDDEHNSNDRKRNRKAVKEAVIDWYEENGYEIDDYEMGRIDQFVESYYEDEE